CLTCAAMSPIYAKSATQLLRTTRRAHPAPGWPPRPTLDVPSRSAGGIRGDRDRGSQRDLRRPPVLLGGRSSALAPAVSETAPIAAQASAPVLRLPLPKPAI